MVTLGPVGGNGFTKAKCAALSATWNRLLLLEVGRINKEKRASVSKMPVRDLAKYRKHSKLSRSI